MDEPLSNLDAKLRVQMRAEIHELQRRLGVTTVYVTHDQTEAMTLGDRVAVMRNGQSAAGRDAEGALRASRQRVRGGVHRIPVDQHGRGRARQRATADSPSASGVTGSRSTTRLARARPALEQYVGPHGPARDPAGRHRGCEPRLELTAGSTSQDDLRLHRAARRRGARVLHGLRRRGRSPKRADDADAALRAPEPGTAEGTHPSRRPCRPPARGSARGAGSSSSSTRAVSTSSIRRRGKPCRG